MKLNQVKAPSQAKAKAAPVIGVCYYNGRFYFNAPSVKLLSLQIGDHIAFFQDDDCPKDWYFIKAPVSMDGAVPLKSKGADPVRSLYALSATIARKMMGSVEIYETTTFYIEPEPVVIGKLSYWKILTDKTIK